MRTSHATEAYLGVSYHFITEDWQMKTLNLATMFLLCLYAGRKTWYILHGRETPGTALASHCNSIWSWSNSKGQTPLWPEAWTPSQQRETTLATALDPRLRKLKYVAAADGKRVKGWQLKSLLSKKQRKPGFMGEEETQADQKIQMVRNEVQMYFAEPARSKKEDPLIWWRENKVRFPTLSKLARSLLCIPATSTPSEQIFSAAGNICSQKRASLIGDHVETFLSLNKL